MVRVVCDNKDCGMQEMKCVDSDSSNERNEDIYECSNCKAKKAHRTVFDQNGLIISDRIVEEGQVSEGHDGSKKYLAIFLVENRGRSYRIQKKVEAKDHKEAKRKAMRSCGRTSSESWKLAEISEVKTFEELWSLIRT